MVVLKKMMRESKKENLNQFIDYLNKDPTKHHQARLITLFYQDIKAKLNFRSDLEMESHKEVKNGKRTTTSAFINSMFSKKDQKDPYIAAREQLPHIKLVHMQELKK